MFSRPLEVTNVKAECQSGWAGDPGGGVDIYRGVRA